MWRCRRSWKEGDQVDLRFKLEPRVIIGDHKNGGKLAVLYGPLVLAAEADLLGDQLSKPELWLCRVRTWPHWTLLPNQLRTTSGPGPGPRFSVSTPFRAMLPSRLKPEKVLSIRLIPFADAGNERQRIPGLAADRADMEVISCWTKPKAAPAVATSPAPSLMATRTLSWSRTTESGQRRGSVRGHAGWADRAAAGDFYSRQDFS